MFEKSDLAVSAPGSPGGIGSGAASSQAGLGGVTAEVEERPVEPRRQPPAAMPAMGWLRGRLGRFLPARDRGTEGAARPYRYFARQLAVDLPLGQTGRALVISSTQPLEASNETLLMFSYFMRLELDCSILLIDGTFRENGVGTRLGHRGEAGFADLVYGTVRSLPELVRATPRRGISVLPAGRVPAEPARQIDPANVAALLQEAQRRFDYVLLQQGSILDDTRFLLCAGGADLVLLIVEEGVTLADELERCKKVFRHHQIANVRLVLSARSEW